MRTGSGLPLELDANAGQPASFDRYDDSKPYYGGARIGTPPCTLGFATWMGWESMMLTADHCAYGGPNSAFDVGGEFVRQFQFPNHTEDTVLLAQPGQVSPQPYLGRVWMGGEHDTTAKRVKGPSRSEIGNYVCASGAYSGERCWARVSAVNVWHDVSLGLDNFPMVQADSLGQYAIAQPGDSGGPMFEVPSPDDGTIIAKA